MTKITKRDEMTEKKYEMNNFDPKKEVSRFSYTSGRVLNAVYNTYEKNEFRVFGYYTDWSQYDGRYEGDYADDKCGRGIDLMRLDPQAFDKIIIGFAAIVGDKGNKKATIDRAAKDYQRKNNEATFTDSWGDVLSYRNCGFGGWKTNDVMSMFNQWSAQGVLGGLKMLKDKNPDLKLAFSVGGWTMSEAFHWITADAEKRRAFSQSIVDIMQRFPMFTEIDLDWEYPNAPGDTKNTWDETDPVNFAKLVKELKQTLADSGHGNVKISIAVSADPEKMRKANIPAMLEAGVWGINLMSYDFFGTPWAKELAHHTNIYSNGGNNDWSLDTAVKALKEMNVPMDQVFVGFAAYSRNAKNAEITSYSPLHGSYNPKPGTTTGTFESGTTEWYDTAANYLDLDNASGKNGFTLYTDEQSDADYLYNSSSKLFLSIETPRTTKAKAEYVKKHGLGGMFTWTIEQDAGLLVNAAREGLGCQLINENIDMSKYYFKGRKDKSQVTAVIDGPTSVKMEERVELSAQNSSSKTSDITQYLWDVPKEILVDIRNKSILSFIAPNVTKARDFNITLTVTDELGDSDSVIHVLKVKTGKEPVYPLWEREKVYWGGDKVSWKDQNWVAKWWSQNDEPGELEDGKGAGPTPWEKID